MQQDSEMLPKPIYRRGIEISPLEIEQVIAGHESVKEVAVVGIPGNDASNGEQRIIAFVVPRAEPEKAALAQYCSVSIAAEKFPDRAYFIRALPRKGQGVLDRQGLVSLAMRGERGKAIRQQEREARSREEPIFASLTQLTGILAVSQALPGIAQHFRNIADELLVANFPGSTLSRGERETIVVAVSAVTDCFSCMDMHGACALEMLGNDARGLIDAVKESRFDQLHAPIRALVEIAVTIARNPRNLQQKTVDAALREGASEADIVLTVAIASFMAMQTRLVDGLRTRTSSTLDIYDNLAKKVSQEGYRNLGALLASNEPK